MPLIRILGTAYLDNGSLIHNYEFRNSSYYCEKDFRKGWKVKIELPKYRHEQSSVLREGIVIQEEADSVVGEKGVKIMIIEKFKGSDRAQPRVYSFYRIRNAWKIE